MSQVIVKSTSFVQENKFQLKTDKFKHVKPEYVEQVLNKHGFNLVALKSGRAVLPERSGHQTTIARYRSASDFKINGLSLDIVAKIPHIYGAIELFLGTYRQVCSNGLVVGEKFTSVKIKHLGNPIAEIDKLIPELVAQEARLVSTIQAMQLKKLTDGQMIVFAQRVAQHRLGDTVMQADFGTLLTPHREVDKATDLFTVMNVIQENSLRSALPYTLPSRRQDGTLYMRNMITRRVNESSSKALEINRTIWNIATDLLVTAE